MQNSGKMLLKSLFLSRFKCHVSLGTQNPCVTIKTRGAIIYLSRWQTVLAFIHSLLSCALIKANVSSPHGTFICLNALGGGKSSSSDDKSLHMHLSPEQQLRVPHSRAGITIESLKQMSSDKLAHHTQTGDVSLCIMSILHKRRFSLLRTLG